MRVEREIVLPVGPAEAWETLTEASHLQAWFANDVELDVRPGGTGVFRWEDGDVRHAVVEVVEEPDRLVLRWDDDGLVELELHDHPEGTRVLVRETAPEWGLALELRAQLAWTLA